MANTFSQLYLHIVFSTKHRTPFIKPEIENDIWAGIGGCARKHGMVALQVGGIDDHAHALVSVPTVLSASQAAKHLKGDSSAWIHREFKELHHFAWQDGYGAFSVSKSVVPDVENYIARQKEHHKRQDFKSEFLELLRRHGVEFDEHEVFQ